ncbi:hypothetical protein AAHB54_29080 [Bacillus cereus]
MQKRNGHMHIEWRLVYGNTHKGTNQRHNDGHHHIIIIEWQSNCIDGHGTS